MAKDKKELYLNCKAYPKINGSDFCNAICATLYKIEKPKKNRIKFRFIWFDIWIGVFIDRPKKKIYIGIIPTLIIIINLNKQIGGEKQLTIKEPEEICKHPQFAILGCPYDNIQCNECEHHN